jgi:hypothetical protein
VQDQATTAGPQPSTELVQLTSQSDRLQASVDNWNTAMVWALVFAALAAVAVVITTRMAIQRSKQLADVQDSVIRIKDTQLSSDLKEKDLAIATAHQAAAEATERAAEANKEAEKERLSRLQLQAQFTDRHLTKNQIVALETVAERHPGTIMKVYRVTVSSEAAAYSNEIETVLKSKGWKVDVAGAFGGDMGAGGIQIAYVQGQSSSIASDLRDTLLRMGQEASVSASPNTPPFQMEPTAISMMVTRRTIMLPK